MSSGGVKAAATDKVPLLVVLVRRLLVVVASSALFYMFLISCFPLQKARLARIQIAKATSGAAFVSKKKAAEAKMAAKAAGMPVDDNFKEDVFELQHHHLLRCLEKTTVRRRIGKAKLNFYF